MCPLLKKMCEAIIKINAHVSIPKTPSVHFYWSRVHKSITVTRTGRITSCYNYCAKEFTELKLLSLWPFSRSKTHIYFMGYLYIGVYGNIILIYSEKYFLEMLNNNFTETHLFWSLFYCSRCSTQCTVHIFCIYFKGFWIGSVNKIFLLKINIFIILK